MFKAFVRNTPLRSPLGRSVARWLALVHVAVLPIPSNATPSSMELRLDGVIVAQDPSASIALVRTSGEERARVLRIGETHAGYVLVEVALSSVLLTGPTGPVRVFLSGEGPLPESIDRPEPESSPHETERDRWERRAFPREASRERLEKEIPVILADTKLEPYVENGDVLGLRLARLPDGTLLSESGLLPGDLLVSLNGEPLADLDSLWETLAHLDGEDELRLIVERRGAVLHLAYDLTR